MIFDTDILIWIERGNRKAAALMNRTLERFISIQTYMELMQEAQNNLQQKRTKEFLTLYDFTVLPLSENIGHRAAIYIEEYSLSSGLRTGDAIIAATATEHHLILSTGNTKHFKPIRDLEIKPFRP